MTSAVAALPQTPRFSRASRCSITELSPDIDDQASKFVDGVVSLIWPYSSSNQSTAILIADPDFRIRRAKGQTKVTFHGSSAIAVAESRVGIGDDIHLSLEGAQWVVPNEDVFIWGKRADWELEYVDQAFMKVHRGTTPFAVVDVHHVSEPVDNPLQEVVMNGGYKTKTPSLNSYRELWSSPAFTKRKAQPPTSETEALLSSSTEDDGRNLGRSRKRTRFSINSGSWRYLERSTSPDGEKNVSDTSPTILAQQEISEIVSEPLHSDHEDENTVLLAAEAQGAEAQGAEAQSEEAQEQDALPPVNDYDATPHSEEISKIMMPPPPLTLQGAHEPSASVQISDGAGNNLQEHQSPGRHSTPRAATTPRLMPLASPGLPLISPLVKQHGAAIGYFPPMPTTQSELDSDADLAFKEPIENFGSDIASPSSVCEFSALPAIESSSYLSQLATVPFSATQTIDLVSPTEVVDEPPRQETVLTLANDVITNDHSKSEPERPSIPPDTFEFLNDSPVEARPFNPTSPEGVLYWPRRNTIEIEPSEFLVDGASGSSLASHLMPATAEKGPDDPEENVCGFSDKWKPNSLLEQASETSTKQLHVIPHLHDSPDLNVSDEMYSVGENDIEQEQTLSTASSTPQRSRHWSEALEISAHEVEVPNLSITAPPFPFKQGWDYLARQQSRAWQAGGALPVARRRSSRRTSYDGASDGRKNSDLELSDDTSSLDSGRMSILYDHDGEIVQFELEKSEGGSEGRTDHSQPCAQDQGSFPKLNIDSETAVQVVELEPAITETAPTVELEVEQDMIPTAKLPQDPDQKVVSDLNADASDDGFGHRSPPSIEEQECSERLPEMPLSSSPSHAPEEELTTFNVSSTSIGDSYAETQSGKSIATFNHVVQIQFTDPPFLKQSDHLVPQPDQLATPNNTQQEVDDSQIQDRLNELGNDEVPVNLPLSPENTQNVEDTDMTETELPIDTREQQEDTTTGVLATQAKSNLEDTEKNVISNAWSSEETRRRRSSRLSGKMPLLAKDPSEINSPYFTPKRSEQRRTRDKAPSSSHHRVFSPNERYGDNVVVLIPAPIGQRSLMKQPKAVALSNSASQQSSSSKRPSHSKGFTTPHSYYPSLSAMPTHFNEEVDILAVVARTSDKPQRSKSGPQDYFVSLRVVDSSCEPKDTATVQLFRPYKNALPGCNRGDVLLLRNMKVQTRQTSGKGGKAQDKTQLDGMMLLSTESSAWAVFKFPEPHPISIGAEKPGSQDVSACSPTKKNAPIKMEVQISGPPIEFGAEERAFARGISKWWIEEGEAEFPDVESQPGHNTKRTSGLKIDVPIEILESLHEHELRDGMAYGDLISPRPLHEHAHHSHQRHLNQNDEDEEGEGEDEGGEEEGDDKDGFHDHEFREDMVEGDDISLTPLHEHLNRDTLDGSQMSATTTPHKLDESLIDESTLHEHELRDGMAYGDIITPRPIHPHFHPEVHNPGTGHDDSHTGKDSNEEQSEHTLQAHTLRNGVTYLDTNVEKPTRTYSVSTPTPTTSTSRSRRRHSQASKSRKTGLEHEREETVENESDLEVKREDEEEGANQDANETEDASIHNLRNRTRYTLSPSLPSSAVPGGEGVDHTSAQAEKSKRGQRKNQGRTSGSIST